jgi:hypothetical protein
MSLVRVHERSGAATCGVVWQCIFKADARRADNVE